METVCRYYRVDRREISYLRFILEAYEGLAMFRTIDPVAGTVALHVAPGCESDAGALIEALGVEIRIEPHPDPVMDPDAGFGALHET